MTELGAFVVPSADDLEGVLAQVQAAEDGGLDLIGIQDHPYQRRYLDTFALIPYLAARTTRLRFFPDVANLPLRHPAMLAKSAASLDGVISDGPVTGTCTARRRTGSRNWNACATSSTSTASCSGPRGT
jgi:alkanesulfonate monooxygenase SsuD/methylene tetrahydromethanopterin reductase-like flavin-dependent oxidoreductase (luciferase family)